MRFVDLSGTSEKPVLKVEHQTYASKTKSHLVVELESSTPLLFNATPALISGIVHIASGLHRPSLSKSHSASEIIVPVAAEAVPPKPMIDVKVLASTIHATILPSVLRDPTGVRLCIKQAFLATRQDSPLPQTTVADSPNQDNKLASSATLNIVGLALLLLDQNRSESPAYLLLPQDLTLTLLFEVLFHRFNSFHSPDFLFLRRRLRNMPRSVFHDL